jgi:hypothetical protein
VRESKKNMALGCFGWMNGMGAWTGVSMFLMAIIIIWSLVWKVIALWKAAKKRQIVWFIVFIFVNTLGILEILYIYVFSKMKPREEEKPQRRRHRTTKRRTSSRRKRKR